MVLRCFARRHLVPVRSLTSQQRCRTISTSFFAQQEYDDPSSTSGINVRQQKKMQPEFFSSTHRISKAFGRKRREEYSALQASSEGVPKHPLVVELRQELYNEDSSPSPERVWNLYLAIHQAAQESQSDLPSSSTLPVDRLSLSLSARDHRHVLRSIAVKTMREERKKANENSLVSYRYEGSLLPGGRVPPEKISQYIERVAFIFSQLRRSEKPDLPGIKEYDQVLERLGPSGNMPALTALWAQLSGKTAEDFSSQKKLPGFPLDSPIQGVEPSGRTYVHLMMGITRHLAFQIERAHRANITNKIWAGQGKRKVRKQANSAQSVSRGTAQYGQEVAPQARLAVQLASARTVSLLQDMFERRVKPDKLTLDLALRMLRMDGNLQGIRMLIKGVFTIDLENPDSDPSATGEALREKLAPDVHTLNTLMMAFGEQGTISEMISAYETIVRPLPTKKVDPSIVMEPEGNLFATDWRGIFRRDAETVVHEEEGQNRVEEGSEVAEYSHPLAIVPNTTTLTLMIKHCCTVPNPSRMVAVPRNANTKRAQMNAQDHAARESGEYIGIASYLLTEAIGWQEQETGRLATQIGVSLPNVNAIVDKIVEWTQECERNAANPDEFDKHEILRNLFEEGRETIRTLDLSEDFVPRFLPPSLTINYDMILPISSFASKRRLADFSLWRWVIFQTQRSIANKVVELQVLSQGISHWEDAKSSADDSLHLSSEALRTLLAALRKQRRMVRDEVNLLTSHMVETFMHRFATLRYKRKQKTAQRFARKHEIKNQLEEAKLAEEQRKQRIALQREEASLLNREAIVASEGLEQSHLSKSQQEGESVPIVEPVFK